MTKQKPAYDAVYRAGTFIGRDGKERNAYQTIGAAWPGEDGQINRIRLDTIPVSWDGVIYLRARQPQPERAGGESHAALNGDAQANLIPEGGQQ